MASWKVQLQTRRMTGAYFLTCKMTINNFFIKKKKRNPLVSQQVKDPALSLLQLGSLLWHGVSPWPREPPSHAVSKDKNKNKKLLHRVLVTIK